MNNLSLKLSKGDLFGGLTAGIVALPLALAFGVQSGMGAAAGLFGAVFLGFFAALLGGTPLQISGPTGPMTVVTAATVAILIARAGDFTTAFPAIIATFVLAGLIQIVMGTLRLGSYIRYIPYPVISGFMSGIGVIIILFQFFPALGLSSPATTLEVFGAIPGALAQVNVWALSFTLLTIGIIYQFPKLTKSVPSTLVALLAVTLLSLLLGHEIPVIGEIPQGFPPIHLDKIFSIDPSMFMVILEAAATLAALGAVDSLLTSVIADNVSKTKHSSNKELIGQGVGNAVSGLFGGIPGAGATMRTLVNVRSGGKTRISGMIHALVLLFIAIGLGKYAALIPKSVLAGILITVGISILDYRALRQIRQIPVTDAVIMVIVLVITVLFDLLIAVGVGILLASILFMKKMGDLMEENSRIQSLEEVSADEKRINESMPESLKNSVYVKQMDGPLFFGSATGFQDLLQKMPDTRYVIIRMEKVPYIDQTGFYALEDSILALEQRNIDVLLCGINAQPLQRLKAVRLIPGLIGKDHVFPDFSACLEWLSVNPVSKNGRIAVPA